MSNYYLILVWVAVAGVLGMILQVKRIETVNGKKVCRYQPLWALIVVLPLIIWAGYRGHVGDTGAYMNMYQDLPSQIGGIVSYMEEVEKDRGFYFLSALLKTVIGNNVNLYFIIIAFIQVGLLVKVYRKYSTHYMMSFFLFLISTDYISWIFNGMRQCLAVMITFSCFELILKKKYVKAAIIILLASLIHGSALLVLPFIFIAQGKSWNKKTLLFIAAVICAVAFVGQFTDLLDTLLAETQYTNVVSDWQASEDNGTNILRVLVYSMPTILSLVGRKYIVAENDQVINLCTNMSIASMGFYVISMFTSGIFIGRLPIYFSLYNYILLPWEIDNMFEEKTKNMIYIVMVCAYLLFYYYQIKLTWGLV
ncbi:MAG: EpsG family protein [Dorea sp.]|nr:EpsG family protein [Dorea sp.]